MTNRSALSTFTHWGILTALVYLGTILAYAIYEWVTTGRGNIVIAGVVSVLAMVVLIVVAGMTVALFMLTGWGMDWAARRYAHIPLTILRRNTTILVLAGGFLLSRTGLTALPVVLVLAVVNWRWWIAQPPAPKKKKREDEA